MQISEFLGARSKGFWLAAAAVALLACTGMVLLYGWATDRPRPAAVLQRTTVEYTFEADALIESAGRAEVYAPSGLRVKEIPVTEGRAVREGDLLARLDTETLELEIARTELNIASAEANMTSEQQAQANSVTSARNALSSAEVSLRAARREYDRLSERQGRESAVEAADIGLDAAKRAHEYNLSLFALGGVSREALTQSETTLEKAQNAYDDALRDSQQALDSAREGFEAAQIRVKAATDTLDDALARNTDPAAIALSLQRVALAERMVRLRDASMTAPIGGILSYVGAKEGAPAVGLMFVIEDPEDLVIRARVNETDVVALVQGTRCLIRPAGQEQAVEGRVTLLPVAAERDATGAFAAVVGDDAFFLVEAVMEKTPPGARIGMNAKVTFIAGTSEHCFAAPNGLIFREGERRWVLGKNALGRIIEIPVETGLETRRVTEIISDALYEGMELYGDTPRR